ncbi:MAG: bifunctional nuclease family protein [Chloroflexota bacterium]
MLEMSIDSLRVNSASNQYVMLLQENEGDRYLPIWIGPAEANAIAMEIQGVKPPRPLTHDLLISIINALGASLDSIVVTELQDEIFYASLVLSLDGDQMEVDSRPSDAIALAVRTNVPVYAEESVLDQAAVLIDPETGTAIPQSEGNQETGAQQESQDLSAFRDVVEGLDLEGLDRNKQNRGDQGTQ